MKSTFNKQLWSVLLMVALIGGSFAGGMYVGTKRTEALVDTTQNIINKDTGQPLTVDFTPFWKAWNLLNEKYVATKGTSTKPVTEQDKVWGAIKGLTEAYGDPYTTFFPPVESKDFQSHISGNFEGIGMEVGLKDGIITVVAPLKDTPAYKAGIKAGDKILKINDTLTSSITIDEAVNLIRGEKGTSVRLTLLSENTKEPREVKVVRDVINIPTIDTVDRKDGVFVIQLYNFSENSAALFRNALVKFANSKSDKLVLDLRGNPGGYLEAAVDMASWFLPADKIVVQEDAGGHGEDIVYKSKGYNVFSNKLKMVILVDGGSASASEILAGALQEHGIAKLIGTKTFGKGSVQELMNLTPDTSLKITIARWLTPNGNSISEQGLKPDIEVPFTIDDAEKGVDPQLNKAIEVLLAK
jgi:carboxyl-terminal processing protease